MKLTSFFLATFVSVGMMSVPASADIGKGQKWYVKSCKACHGSGIKGSAMKTQDQWDEFFAKGGEIIIKKHLGTNAELFFNSDTFKNQAQDLRDFLFEYGSDSGTIPPC